MDLTVAHFRAVKTAMNKLPEIERLRPAACGDQPRRGFRAGLFDEASGAARVAISAIAEGVGTSFAEVIEALELAEGDLDRVSGVFYNLAGADSTEAREALMRTSR